MARYLLDTNICIHIRGKRPASVLKRFEKLAVGEAAISVITYGELAYGVARSPEPRQAPNRRLLAELVGLLPVLPIPEGAGETHGALREAMERTGQMIGNNDLWIAAHAMAENLILVTSNEREFKRASGLKIENWVR